jgi:hypothetical protein
VETAGYLPLLMRDGRRIFPVRRADLRHEVRQLDLRRIPGKNKGWLFKKFLLTYDGFQVKIRLAFKGSC